MKSGQDSHIKQWRDRLTGRCSLVWSDTCHISLPPLRQCTHSLHICRCPVSSPEYCNSSPRAGTLPNTEITHVSWWIKRSFDRFHVYLCTFYSLLKSLVTDGWHIWQNEMVSELRKIVKLRRTKINRKVAFEYLDETLGWNITARTASTLSHLENRTFLFYQKKLHKWENLV